MYKYILAILLSINHLIALSILDKNISKNMVITDKFIGIMSELDSSNSVQKDFNDEEYPLKIFNANGDLVSNNIYILFRIFSDKITKHSLNNLKDFAKIAIQNYDTHVVLRLNAYHKQGKKYNKILLHKRTDKLIYLLERLGVSYDRIYIEDIVPQESNLLEEILGNNREINLYLYYPNYKKDYKEIY